MFGLYRKVVKLGLPFIFLGSGLRCQDNLEIREISKGDAEKLIGQRWLSLDEYKSHTYRMKCKYSGYYMNPGGMGCLLEERRRPVCEYQFKGITLSDGDFGDYLMWWDNKVTEYALPSGIKLYSVHAYICEGGGAAGTAVRTRYYSSKSSQFWETTYGFYSIPFSEHVSPDGKVLVIIQASRINVWDLEEDRIIRGGEGLQWIYLVQHIGNMPTPCGPTRVYSVGRKRNAFIYTMDITEPNCERKTPKYYLISW
ncbi:MAG: hypothetical protein ABDH91_09005 [Bacteroidia bacterium]